MDSEELLFTLYIAESHYKNEMLEKSMPERHQRPLLLFIIISFVVVADICNYSSYLIRSAVALVENVFIAMR